MPTTLIVISVMPDAEWAMIQGDCLDAMQKLPDNSIQLVLTSPPYGITTAYAKKSPLKKYLEWIKPIIHEIVRILAPTGAIAFQVGTYVDNKEIYPLDMEFYPLFREYGLHLRNRIVWHFGSGFHARYRLSGRHETVMWWTASDEYTFNLDNIRVPQKEPGKIGYRGKKKGELSGNPLGKNPSDVWLDLAHQEFDSALIDQCPNVKGSHVEKTAHPCQMPIELCERCVLAWSKPGDIVLDPFAGVGSTLCAAVRNGRNALGLELSAEYVKCARERVQKCITGDLPFRPLGKRISEGNKRSRELPESWEKQRKRANKG